MLSLYEILKASKTGIAPDMWTALAGMNWGGADSGHEVKELTGIPPLSFTADGTSLLDYLISGNMSQTGTPTPSNPVDVNGVGVMTGNLFDGEWAQGGINISGNPVISSGRIRTYQAVQPNTTYTFSSTKYVRLIYGYNGDEKVGVIYDVGYGLSQSATFTTQSNCTRIGIVIAASTTSTGNILPSDISDVMLITGSTAEPYEPYGYKIPILSGGVTTNIYLGSTQTVRQVYKIEYTGAADESWTIVRSGTANAYAQNSDNPAAIQGLDKIICTHYEAGEIYNANTNTGVLVVSNGGVRIRDTNAASMSVDSFKTYLQQQYANGTPVTVWYVLATPETGIVNEPLMKIGNYADTLSMEQAQLQIPTNKGNTVVDVETTLKPSQMYIKYQQ